MTKNTPVLLRRTLQTSSVCAFIAVCGIAGCSRSDDAQAAVQKANHSMNSIAAGDSTVAPSFAEQAYRDAEELAGQFAGSEDGYSEAAAVTVALAKLGRASLASKDASIAETQALHKARVIRGMLNEWLTMTAISKGASLFDASAELDDISKLINLRKDDIQAYTAQRKRIDAQIAELDEQIAELRSKSDAQRNQAGGLELEMPRVSATQAAEIAVRVREHTLRADNYELEAVRIEGVVGQLRPGAREISLNVEKANSQVTLLEEARNELKEREASSLADARQAQEAAEQAAKRINDAVAEYSQFRDAKVNTANEKATSLARSASSALRDANRATKQIASLSKASIQQTLGECYARQATGHAESALLYQALTHAQIPGDWESLAQRALENQAQAQESANSAFQAAASALRSARIRGIEGEKLEASAVRIDRLGGIEPEPEYEETYEEAEDFEEEFIEDDQTEMIDEEPSEDDD